VGGVGANGGWLPDTWAYEVTGRWSTRAALPTPRDHVAVAAYRGSICAAGGNGGPQVFECYHPVRDEWTRGPDLRKPVLGGRAARPQDGSGSSSATCTRSTAPAGISVH